MVTCADILGHVGSIFHLQGAYLRPSCVPCGYHRMGNIIRMGISLLKPAITPPPELKRNPKRLPGDYEKLRASLMGGMLLLPDDTGVRSESLVPSSLHDCTMHGIYLRHNRAATAHAPAIFHGALMGGMLDLDVQLLTMLAPNPQYEYARTGRTWNYDSMGAPSGILQPGTVDDVAACIKYAAENQVAKGASCICRYHLCAPPHILSRDLPGVLPGLICSSTSSSTPPSGHGSPPNSVSSHTNPVSDQALHRGRAPQPPLHARRLARLRLLPVDKRRDRLRRKDRHRAARMPLGPRGCRLRSLRSRRHRWARSIDRSRWPDPPWGARIPRAAARLDG